MRGRIDTHTITFEGATFCAGCAGLTFGAVSAVAFTAYVLAFGSPFTPYAAFWGGLVLTVVGVLQHALDFDDLRVHSAQNGALVLGAAVARVGAEGINGGWVVDA